MPKKKMTDIELVELIKKIITELQKSKTGKTPQITPNGLGISNPIKMKRLTQRTQIAELKDRIRIKNLEKELLKRDVTQTTQDARDMLRNFLNSRSVYEDNGYTVEEPDDYMYTQPTTQGFSMSDNYGTFGESVGSDRFLVQRSPFQLQRGSMIQQPLELESQSVASAESDIVQQQQPSAYMQDQPDVFGYEDIPDFGVDPYAQADAPTPYFDQSQEPPAPQQDIEMSQFIGRRPTRTARIEQLRTKYRDIAGLESDPTIYRSKYIKQIEPAIRDILLRQYIAGGGANPQVLKSKNIGLIENELQNLKDALRL
jgi:hypothetical protein